MAKTTTDDDAGWMHIYPQYAHHSDVVIVGNEAALIALRDACSQALLAKKAEAVAYTRDGEGYGIVITKTNATGVRLTSLPYTADWCRDLRTNPDD